MRLEINFLVALCPRHDVNLCGNVILASGVVVGCVADTSTAVILRNGAAQSFNLLDVQDIPVVTNDTPAARNNSQSTRLWDQYI